MCMVKIFRLHKDFSLFSNTSSPSSLSAYLVASYFIEKGEEMNSSSFYPSVFPHTCLFPETGLPDAAPTKAHSSICA